VKEGKVEKKVKGKVLSRRAGCWVGKVGNEGGEAMEGWGGGGKNKEIIFKIVKGALRRLEGEGVLFQCKRSGKERTKGERFVKRKKKATNR